MSTFLGDLIQFYTSGGTGTLTVTGAVSPFMTPATYGAPFNSGTTTVFYSIVDPKGGNSETGQGSYNASGTVLTRTTVYASTNGGSAINATTAAFVSFTALAESVVNKTGDTMSGALTISAAVASISTSTGALILSGASAGLGVAGAGWFGGDLNSGGSLRWGASGSTGAGSLYSDANWGALYIAKTTSPTVAMHAWADHLTTVLMRLSPTGGLNIGGSGDPGAGNLLIGNNSANAVLYINAGTTAYQASMQLQFAGTTRWQYGSQGVGSSYQFFFYDSTNGINAFVINQGITTTGNVVFGYTTPSTSTTTGALVVSGGLGVAGAGWFGGALNVTVATDASSISTGSLILSGGLGIAKSTYFGTGGNVAGGFTATSYSIGALGAFAVNIALGNFQYGTNSNTSAWAITAPSSDGVTTISMTNAASGTLVAPTFTGFTVGANTGDALTTTHNSVFYINIIRINGVSTYVIKALQ